MPSEEFWALTGLEMMDAHNNSVEKRHEMREFIWFSLKRCDQAHNANGKRVTAAMAIRYAINY